jgi:YcaO-like protein with predicted kinase domain
MEAVERVSAETAPSAGLYCSFEELAAAGRPVADPRTFDLPTDSAFRPDLPIWWIAAHDLLSQQSVLLARDLAITPPREGVLRDVDTNGLAAGNTLLEAVVHGLCEVIERDAVGVDLFRKVFGGDDPQTRSKSFVSQESMPDRASRLIAGIASHGQRVDVEYLEADVGVPTFRCELIDEWFPTGEGARTRRFVGFGASPCSEIAVVRSITEAVQSRIAIVQGARDSYNSLSPSRSFQHAADASEEVEFGSVPTFETDDLREDYVFLLESLRRAGAESVLAVELTRPDLDIPVVRVRVPGLTSFLVNRRRVGWRCLRYLL